MNGILSYVSEVLKVERLHFVSSIEDFSFCLIGGDLTDVEILKSSEIVDSWSWSKPYLNFNLKPSFMIELTARSSIWSLRDPDAKRVVFEYSSFNPTALPHAGNLHLFFHGSVLRRCMELLSWKVDDLYYVNDVGGQLKQAVKSLLEEDAQSYYSGSDIEQIKTELGDREINERNLTSLFMPKILSRLSRYDRIPRFYKFESGLRKLALALVRKLKTSVAEEGSVFYRGLENRYFLLKPDGEPTYFLSDLALQYEHFTLGYDRSYLMVGGDHVGHLLKIRELLEVLGTSKDFIKTVRMGQLKVAYQDKDLAFSKRKKITQIPFVKDEEMRFLSLSLPTLKDVVVNENFWDKTLLKWRKFFDQVRSFRLIGRRSGWDRRDSLLFRKLAQFQDCVRLSVNLCEIRYLNIYAFKLASLFDTLEDSINLRLYVLALRTLNQLHFILKLDHVL